MSSVKFLIDECVSNHLLHGVREHLPTLDITQVGEDDGPPKGISDPELLIYAEKNDRLLVSTDHQTLPFLVSTHLLQGRHTYGVLLIGHRISFERIAAELNLLHAAGTAEQWIDQLIFLASS